MKCYELTTNPSSCSSALLGDEELKEPGMTELS